MKTITVETDRDKKIINVLLAEDIIEFLSFLKEELNTGTLSDYLIDEFAWLSATKASGVFLFKINKKIIAIKECDTNDIPHLPKFDSWAASDVVTWIKKNGSQFERLQKIKGFW